MEEKKMICGKFLKTAAVITLFFFTWCLIAPDLAYSSEEDKLARARKLYELGDYEAAIQTLTDFIEKLKEIVNQKKSVAEAFYLMAKIYYEIGDDQKVDENLRNVFETYAKFSVEEPNRAFRSRVEKIRTEVEKKRKMDEQKREEEKVKEKQEELKEEPETKKVIEKTKEKKKKKKFPVLLVVGGIVVVGALVYFLLLKEKKKYNLNVTKGEGVDGTPGSGTYTYKKGETVNYNYGLQGGYTELYVTLDGNEVSPRGTIKMDRDHTLAAAATRTGSILVVSDPEGASIWLDGVDTGRKTPSLLEDIIPGPHTVRLTNQGYEDYETTVDVEAGAQVTVSATLVLYMEWVTIPAGEFQMGDNFNEGDADELPVHTVYLDSYKISKYEVTFDQYDRFCEKTGRSKPNDEGWGRGTRPVINVSWHDIRAFCEWMSQNSGKNIHVPTEAQWEKAARGTDQWRYPWGNGAPSCTLANHSGCERRTEPVGSHPQGVSFYGVHDMAGNVWEWCSDWYSPTYYSISPWNNPLGPVSGSTRVLRGGAWLSLAYDLRSANRYDFDPSKPHRKIGIRLCQE
jgi:formylglycine-generating enzyme required for sulfatase activity